MKKKTILVSFLAVVMLLVVSLASAGAYSVRPALNNADIEEQRCNVDVEEQEQVVAEEELCGDVIGIHVVVHGTPFGGGDRYPLEGAYVKVGLGLGVVSGHTDSRGVWYGSIPYPFARPYIVQASKEGYFGRTQLVFMVAGEVVSCYFTLVKRLFNQQNSQQVNIS